MGACYVDFRESDRTWYPERFRAEQGGAQGSRSREEQLDAWYAEAAKATWKSPAELKAQYRAASIISSERVVFNIKGNDYRLIVAINYHYQVLLIKWLGTHKEYDRIDVEKVEYEKERYANPSN